MTLIFDKEFNNVCEYCGTSNPNWIFSRYCNDFCKRQNKVKQFKTLMDKINQFEKYCNNFCKYQKDKCKYQKDILDQIENKLMTIQNLIIKIQNKYQI